MTGGQNEEQTMADRARDWFAQADKDLDMARLARSSGSHDWACFASQQSAEKAVKALHLHLGQEACAPFEHYGTIQSSEAIAHADQILAFVRAQMA